MHKKKPQQNYKRIPVEKPKSAPPQTIITRFNLATGEFETYDNVHISSKFEQKQHRYLQNELGKLQNEVDYYVEEVIIPELMD